MSQAAGHALVLTAAPGADMKTTGQLNISAPPRLTSRCFGSRRSSKLTFAFVSSEKRIEKLMSPRG